jgi:hypothetical protein
MHSYRSMSTVVYESNEALYCKSKSPITDSSASLLVHCLSFVHYYDDTGISFHYIPTGICCSRLPVSIRWTLKA